VLEALERLVDETLLLALEPHVEPLGQSWCIDAHGEAL
jgi:hypothetical protein